MTFPFLFVRKKIFCNLLFTNRGSDLGAFLLNPIASSLLSQGVGGVYTHTSYFATNLNVGAMKYFIDICAGFVFLLGVGA